MTESSARPEHTAAADPPATAARPADTASAGPLPPAAPGTAAMTAPVTTSAASSAAAGGTSLPRLRLPGVSGTADASADGAVPKARRRGAGEPNVRAKDRRGNASRDQRKFVPRRGGG